MTLNAERMQLPSVLIIDDAYALNRDERELVKRYFALREIDDSTPEEESLCFATFCSGLTTDGVFDLREVVSQVRSGWNEDGPRWALVIVDYYFNEKDEKGDFRGTARAAEIVSAIKSQISADVPIVLFSSYSVGSLEANVRQGAAFLHKPEAPADRDLELRDYAVLRRDFHRILLQHGLFADGLVRSVDVKGGVRARARSREAMVGTSLTFLKTLRDARASLHGKHFPALLIEGPEGSGKDELVRYVHDWAQATAESLIEPDDGERSDKGDFLSFRVGEMTAVEIALLSAGDMEQELKNAKFGTLHIDPVEILPPWSQQFFIRWIEERIRGGRPDNESPQILVFTSGQSIQQLLERGLLSPSLADQLDVIRVPGVFDRGGAVELLDHFLQKTLASGVAPEQDSPTGEPAVQEAEPQEPPALNAQAKEIVKQHKEWPGNVRQLRRVAALLSARNQFRRSIEPDEIAACIARTSAYRIPGSRPGLRGLVDRIGTQRIGEHEQLYGILKDFREAGANLVTQVITREIQAQKYNIESVAGDLLDDQSLKGSHAPKRLNRWLKFFVGGIKTGDQALDDRLKKYDKTEPEDAGEPRRGKKRPKK